MRIAVLALCLCSVLFVAGCNAQQEAETVSAGISTALSILNAEIPQFPAQDQPIMMSFDNLGSTLIVQANGCIAGAGSKKLSILNCFGTFAAGLLSPTELAQLRILSPKSQADVELVATGVIVGINVLEAEWHGTVIPQPTIGPAPTAAALTNYTRNFAGLHSKCLVTGTNGWELADCIQ